MSRVLLAVANFAVMQPSRNGTCCLLPMARQPADGGRCRSQRAGQVGADAVGAVMVRRSASAGGSEEPDEGGPGRAGVEGSSVPLRRSASWSASRIQRALAYKRLVGVVDSHPRDVTATFDALSPRASVASS